MPPSLYSDTPLLKTNVRPLALCVVLLCCGLPNSLLHAQQEEIWQMHHASWSSREGAPRDINAVVQGKDGLLWLASEQGVFTFDGFDFKPVTAQNDGTGELRKATSQLVVGADGSVWFARRVGGVEHLQGEHLETFSRLNNGASFQALNFLQQDRSGMIWAVLDDKGPGYLGPDRAWHRLDLTLSAHTQAFFVDSRETSWLVQGNKLYRRSMVDKAFVATDLRAYAPALIREGPDHTIWISGVPNEQERRAKSTSVVYHIDQEGQLLHQFVSPGLTRDILIDRRGGVWFAIAGEGVRKLSITAGDLSASQMRNHSFLTSDGLTSNDAWSLGEDFEGSIWASGARGVDRFTFADLPPVMRTQVSGLWSSCSEASGDMLLGVDSGNLYRLHRGTAYEVKGTREVNGLFCTTRDALLLDAKGIARIDGGRVARLPLLPAHTGFWDNYIFASICEVGPQALYAWATGANEDALWLFDGLRWRRAADAQRLGPVITLSSDGNGLLFLGRRDGKVESVAAGNLTGLAISDVNTGPVMGFARTAEGVAAFGGKGIAVRVGQEFRPLTVSNPLVTTRVTGLVQMSKGDLWVNSAAGISVIPHQQMQRALQDDQYKAIAHQVSGPNETAPLRFALGSGGSAHKDNHGTLYFGTTDGIVSFDPNTSPTNDEPDLRIISLNGDGFPPGPTNTFRAGTHLFRIQYLGVHLSDPGGVSYRYRLVGSDADWQQVGVRREAVYTNLAPGTYRFEVMASSGGNEWTEPVKSSPFVILPYFWQTWWFAAAVFVGVSLFLYASFQSRLRVARERARLLADERAEERTRIARELHDTLLQGVQGLLLTFSTVRQRLLHGDDVLPLMDRSLSATEALIVEGRERIANIRHEAPFSYSLGRRLRTLCANLEADTGISVRSKVSGTARDLKASVSEECYFIAREALRNSVLHAVASEIRVELQFERRLFRMTCRDNGRGFNVAAPNPNKDSGAHWGIDGMRERATSVQAQLQLLSEVGRGTQVIVKVDSKFAYMD